MTQTKLFLLAKEKEAHSNHTKSFKKNGSKKHWTADQDLEQEHERFVKYVDMDFKKDQVPVTDEEIREHIKKSFRKKSDLKFIEEYASNDSYKPLIGDIWDSKEYQNALESKKQPIRIKRKTRTQTRKGVPINSKYYYIIVKPHKTKSGKRIGPTRRFYSVTTGKQVKTKNVNKYFASKENTHITPNVIKTSKKGQRPTVFQRYKKREALKERLKRIRGNK